MSFLALPLEGVLEKFSGSFDRYYDTLPETEKLLASFENWKKLLEGTICLGQDPEFNIPIPNPAIAVLAKTLGVAAAVLYPPEILGEGIRGGALPLLAEERYRSYWQLLSSHVWPSTRHKTPPLGLRDIRHFINTIEGHPHCIHLEVLLDEILQTKNPDFKGAYVDTLLEDPLWTREPALTAARDDVFNFVLDLKRGTTGDIAPGSMEERVLAILKARTQDRPAPAPASPPLGQTDAVAQEIRDRYKHLPPLLVDVMVFYGADYEKMAGALPVGCACSEAELKELADNYPKGVGMLRGTDFSKAARAFHALVGNVVGKHKAPDIAVLYGVNERPSKDGARKAPPRQAKTPAR